MTEWFYPTAFNSWGEEEEAAIARVHASGRYTQGDEVAAFEEAFAAFHGKRHSVMCNSGSSANLLSVAALCVKQDSPLSRGDLALVPSIAWATTFAPLVQHGLDLRIADVDATWNVPAAPLTKDARLLVTCSVLGNPCDYRGIERHTKSWGGYWIDDCCESVGAWTGPLDQKKFAGTFAHLNTFSLFWSHQLSAIEGGVVLTDDDELADLCRCLRDHGMTRFRKPKTFDEEYSFVQMGWNLRGLEMHAAVAREQLKKLETFSRFRQANWNNFAHVAHTLHYPIQMQVRLRNGVMNPFGIAFTCESTEARSRLVKEFRANGIDCRLPTGGSFRKHFYAAQWADQQTPNADAIHSRGLFLGNAPFALDQQIEKALKIIKGVL